MLAWGSDSDCQVLPGAHAVRFMCDLNAMACSIATGRHPHPQSRRQCALARAHATAERFTGKRSRRLNTLRCQSGDNGAGAFAPPTSLSLCPSPSLPPRLFHPPARLLFADAALSTSESVLRWLREQTLHWKRVRVCVCVCVPFPTLSFSRPLPLSPFLSLSSLSLPPCSLSLARSLPLLLSPFPPLPPSPSLSVSIAPSLL